MRHGLTDEVKARVSEATEALREARRRNRGSRASSCRCSHFRILRAGPVRGVLEFGALRLGSLWLLRRRPQRPRQPIRGKPRCRLRHGGQAPHYAGQLPAFERRVREVLLSGSAGAHAYYAGLRRLHTRNATSFSPLRARVPHSSSAKSAILSRCTCLTFSRCRSISQATAA